MSIRLLLPIIKVYFSHRLLSGGTGMTTIFSSFFAKERYSFAEARSTGVFLFLILVTIVAVVDLTTAALSQPTLLVAIPIFMAIMAVIQILYRLLARNKWKELSPEFFGDYLAFHSLGTLTLLCFFEIGRKFSEFSDTEITMQVGFATFALVLGSLLLRTFFVAIICIGIILCFGPKSK